MSAVIETIRQVSRDLKLGISAGQITTVRSREEEQTAVRAYDAGCVGLAWANGSGEGLVDRARDALGFGVPHPGPAEPVQAESSAPGVELSDEACIEFVSSVLAELNHRFPDLLTSFGGGHRRQTLQLERDDGTRLMHRSVDTWLALMLRQRGSPATFDDIIYFEDGELDRDTVIERISAHWQAFRHTLETPPSGPCRVIFAGPRMDSGGPLFKLLQTDALAHRYASGASAFAGRLGQRVFSERLSVLDSRRAEGRVAAFDLEGVVRPELGLPLVQDGVLRNLASNRRDAVATGLPSTGCAAGELDALPAAKVGHLSLVPTVDTLADLLEGEPGVLVWLSVGGDCTREGDVGMPVQVAYALGPDGERLGRLPEFTLSGSIYRALGDDFIGVSRETIDPYSRQHWLACRMTAS